MWIKDKKPTFKVNWVVNPRGLKCDMSSASIHLSVDI